MDPQLYRATTEGDILEFVKEMEHATHGRCHHPSASCLQLGPQKTTVLHISTTYAHYEIVKLICKDLPDLVTEKNAKGDTPLHIAARSGDSLLVTFLINADSRKDPLGEKNNEGNTPLHEALIRGHEEVARMLINKNRNMAYSLNNRGESLLFLAAEAGLVTVVRMLLDNPAGKCSGPEKEAKKSPVLAAILRCNTDVLSLLLQKDAASLSQPKTDKGENPLHVAARRGYLEGVKILLHEHREFSYQKDKQGYYPIHAAASKGLLDIVEVMLEQCPDMRELLTAYGQNILHLAAKSGKSNVVTYMLNIPELEYLINEKDEDGNTPLHLASICGHPKVVRVLISDERVDLNQVNDNLQTPLDIAEEYMETGYPPFQKLLTLMALRVVDAPRGDQTRTFRSINSRIVDQPETESWRDKINILLLVATVVATVTFQAAFSIPGGSNNTYPDMGTATMIEKVKFREFVICDIIAFHSSIMVVITLLWAQLGDPSTMRFALKLSLPLLGVSLAMMSIAFLVSMYLVVRKLIWLANLVLIIGTSFTVAFAILYLPLCFLGSSKYRVFRQLSYYPFCFVLYLFGT